MGKRKKRIRPGVFVSATDTEVGKTVVCAGLALALQKQDINVGLMKPIQCAGDDTKYLIKTLGLKDPRPLINPYYTNLPLAPNIAFARANLEIKIPRIINALRQLQLRHEFLIVEGVGGLFAPIKSSYLVRDLVADLGLGLIIVSRPGLGTLNHTLLTISAARAAGIEIIGVVINYSQPQKYGIPEKTNPEFIKKLGGVPILGIIPFLDKNQPQALRRAFLKQVDLKKIIVPPPDKTEPLIQKDRRYLWHPFTQMQDWRSSRPLIIDEARGCYLRDTQGRWYLDGVSSLWVNIHGHKHKKINAAISQQLAKVAHSTLLGLGNIPSIELAAELTDIAPIGLKKVFFSDTGATAVEIALKMAYQYWQNRAQGKKKKFIHLEYSYHGDTLGAMSVGGIDLFHKIYRPLLARSFKAAAPYCYRCPKNKRRPKCGLACLDRLSAIMRKNHSLIAALIIEPLVQAAGGMIIWPQGILKRMRRLCRQYNILLIADEVATGFGRTGKMFACEHERVSPDILCLAKGLSAGYLPLAATLATDEIYNAFLGDYRAQKTFFHGHTYTGNPLACSAALANLELFRTEKTLLRLSPKIEILKKGLQQFKKLKYVGDVRQKGLMAGIELVKNKATQKPFACKEQIGIRVCAQARKYGVILRPLGNVIVLMPPLATSQQELEKIIQVTYISIREVSEC